MSCTCTKGQPEHGVRIEIKPLAWTHVTHGTVWLAVGWHAYCYKCPASPLMLCVPAWLCPFRYNKGYALLLYDNSDISAYMKQFYPGFMPSEQDQHMHGGCWSYSAT